MVFKHPLDMEGYGLVHILRGFFLCFPSGYTTRQIWAVG